MVKDALLQRNNAKGALLDRKRAPFILRFVIV